MLADFTWPVWSRRQKEQDDKFAAEDARLRAMLDDLQRSRQQVEHQADKTITRWRK